MVDDLPRSGDITDSGFFGTEGGDGAAALDPAVIELVDELMANAPEGSGGLLQVLLKLQGAFDRVSWRVQELVADRYSLSPAQVAGLVSFYPKLSDDRLGRLKIDVCTGSACWLAGSSVMPGALEEEISGLQGSGGDPRIAIGETSCFGICGQAPVIRCHDRVRTGVEEGKAAEVIASVDPEPLPEEES